MNTIPSIYVASRKNNAARLRAHRDSGVPIISTWIDAVDTGATYKPTPEDIWNAAYSEITRCDVFILYDGGDGAIVEMALAIGAGVRVIVVAPAAHPLAEMIFVDRVETLAQAYEMSVQEEDPEF